MTFRVDAPAFVPKNRSSASVVATNARDDVDAGATAGAGANANAVTGETTTAVAVTATSGDVVVVVVVVVVVRGRARAQGGVGGDDEGVGDDARGGERLKAAAAQAGRLSKAYSNVDEDVKRLTRELEEKTEQCEQAWELATMRESERDDALAAAARERDGLKEDLKAALRKALSTADELSRVKKSMVENEGTSSRAEARVEALESMLRAKEEEPPERRRRSRCRGESGKVRSGRGVFRRRARAGISRARKVAHGFESGVGRGQFQSRERARRVRAFEKRTRGRARPGASSTSFEANWTRRAKKRTR